MAVNETNQAIIRSLLYTAGTPGTRLDPYHVVKISAAYTIDLCAGGTGAPDIPYGIVQPNDDDPLDVKAIVAGTIVSGSYADGTNVAVCRGGECMVMVGTTGITAGSFVMANASGHVVDYVAGGYILGIAMETATSTNLGRIYVEPMATASAITVERQVVIANGAITITNGFVVPTKAGVAAMTLADPAAADNYDVLTIVSGSAYAHTVTADFNGSGSATYTMPAEVGAKLVLTAYGGKWTYPTTIKTTAFVGALTGNATTATTASVANSITAASIFLSTEQTANGSAQNVAHGLGATPSLAIAFVSSPTGSAGDAIAWTAGATNVAVTATSGVKYFVLAVK